MGKVRSSPLWQDASVPLSYATLSNEASTSSQDSDTAMERYYNESDVMAYGCRALRVLLGSPSPLQHTQLRQAVLSSSEPTHESKCTFELAILSLIEQGLLTRHGLGNCALYLIPDTAISRAEALAFSDYYTADEQQLMLTLKQLSTRTPCAINPLRRLSSPRAMHARMGVAKPSGRQGRGGKRSLGSSDDLSNIMQKRFKSFQLSGSGGAGTMGALAPGPMPMSP